VTRPAEHAPFTVVDAEVYDGTRTIVTDVRVAGGFVVDLGADLTRPGERRVDAAGAALIPGLHDHHLHLLAMAAARRSTDVSACVDAGAFDEAVLRAARTSSAGRAGWVRVVGLDDHHGPVDRIRLDRLAPDRPVRVQHRSGAAWVLNTRALAVTELADVAPDGWVHRNEDELTRRWEDGEPLPALGPVGRRLASLGVTGVTDATPTTDPTALTALAAARRDGVVRQRVIATGGPVLAASAFPAELERGPVKVVIGDHALPSVPELVEAFQLARRAGRAVAVHCVTRVALVLALTAWSEVGTVQGDRVEHGSVIPLELLSTLADLGLTVVTQPGFVRERGDRYLREVDADDVDHLYRCGSLLAAGIGVGGSTDAPFGPDDPWVAIATMVSRTTTSGRLLGPGEVVAPTVALARFLSDPLDPGGPPRTVRAGIAADLVLLDRDLSRALDAPSSRHVAATWVGGSLVHGEPGC
jgi:predicted amidohydrolase YtcJ